MGVRSWLFSKYALAAALIVLAWIDFLFLQLWAPPLDTMRGLVYLPLLLLSPLVLTGILVARGLSRRLEGSTDYEGFPSDRSQRLGIGLGAVGALAGPAGLVGFTRLWPDHAGLAGIPYVFSAALAAPLLFVLSGLGLWALVAALRGQSRFRRRLRYQGFVCLAIPVLTLLYWPHFLAFLVLGAFSLLPSSRAGRSAVENPPGEHRTDR